MHQRTLVPLVVVLLCLAGLWLRFSGKQSQESRAPKAPEPAATLVSSESAPTPAANERQASTPLKKRLSFSGLKAGEGAILEVWRPIAGQGPGLYRLELDEAQSVAAEELFAGSAWVLLRRVLHGDLHLVPEVHWLAAGSLPDTSRFAESSAGATTRA